MVQRVGEGGGREGTMERWRVEGSVAMDWSPDPDPDPNACLIKTCELERQAIDIC